MRPSKRIRRIEIDCCTVNHPFVKSGTNCLVASIVKYLDEQYDIINSTNQMKKTKVNKLKKAVTAIAKKAIKKAKKK